MHDAVLSTQCLASHLNIEPSQVLVASTGVIGSFLPMPNAAKRNLLCGLGAELAGRQAPRRVRS